MYLKYTHTKNSGAVQKTVFVLIEIGLRSIGGGSAVVVGPCRQNSVTLKESSTAHG